MKVLFILKKNENYSFFAYTRRSSGLWNSTRFITESLNNREVNASIVEVNDNNDIDREVSAFTPDIVIVEALWVVPEKFDILKKLHPKVKWYCHMHSGLPFLALEGIATEWLKGYVKRGLKIIANSTETYDAFCAFLPAKQVVYLPNVYISKPVHKELKEHSKFIDIGCFGAVRPMKNHLHQAIAAIKFARSKNKKLRFWINSSRIETNGDPVLKNLIKLFEGEPDCELMHCKWNEPEEFINLLNGVIDIGMQVSLTETFNVVSADYVTAGVPVVTSKAVKWVSRFNKCEEESINDTIRIMNRVYLNKWLVILNRIHLFFNSHKAVGMWHDFIKSER